MSNSLYDANLLKENLIFWSSYCINASKEIFLSKDLDHIILVVPNNDSPDILDFPPLQILIPRKEIVEPFLVNCILVEHFDWQVFNWVATQTLRETFREGNLNLSDSFLRGQK